MYFCILFFGLLLLGCDRQSNESYLLHHPSKFKAILQQCVMISKDQIKQYPQCELAVNLYGQILHLTRELFHSPEQYGKAILSLQMKRGQLQQQVFGMTGKKRQLYQSQLDQINHKIKIRLLLLANS